VIWDQLSEPWRASLEESWSAYRAGSIPIGSVITDRGGWIVARGRNRIFEGTADPPFLHGHRLAHAEMNALVSLGNSEPDPTSLVLYTTVEPCALCTGAIRMALIGEVRYAARDPLAGSTELFGASRFMRRRPIKIVGPEREDLEALVIAMNVEFELRSSEVAVDENFPALEDWQPVLPRAVEFGEVLYRSGALQDLRERGASTRQVIEHLATML
jgi:tRNA(adenine34) deaminase